MLGVPGPLEMYALAAKSLELAESTLMSLTSEVTPSSVDLGAGAGEAAEIEGDEAPLTLGTKTAAATLRALRAPLSGLEGALRTPRDLLGELAGDAAEAAESPEAYCEAGDLGVWDDGVVVEAEVWSNGHPSFWYLQWPYMATLRHGFRAEAVALVPVGDLAASGCDAPPAAVAAP